MTVFYFWEGSFSRTWNIFATLLVRMIGKNLKNFLIFNIRRFHHKKLKGLYIIKICFSLIRRRKYSFRNSVDPHEKEEIIIMLLVKNVPFFIMCALKDNIIVLARWNSRVNGTMYILLKKKLVIICTPSLHVLLWVKNILILFTLN